MVVSRAADRAPAPPLSELTRVTAIRPLRQGNEFVPEGATGTIVHVYPQGDAFEVEFTSPLRAVVLARGADIRPA